MERQYKVYLNARIHDFLAIEKIRRGKNSLSDVIEDLLKERGIDIDVYSKVEHKK